jgi:acetyltransferase-like isoleucine patch superfamily enzyme
MGALSAFLSKWWRDKKIYYRINYRYLNMFPGSRIRSALSANVEKLIRTDVIIEENVTIGEELKSLGRCVYIGKNAYIASCSAIGSFTSISAGVRIGLMAHPSDFISTSPVFYAPRRGWVKESLFAEDEGKKITIGNDVLISANALIRNGVKIGHGAIIGAGSFVNDDVPPYAVVAGVPARVIRYRFDEAMIAKLLASEWWNKTDAEIKAAGSYNQPEQFLSRLAK